MTTLWWWANGFILWVPAMLLWRHPEKAVRRLALAWAGLAAAETLSNVVSMILYRQNVWVYNLVFPLVGIHLAWRLSAWLRPARQGMAARVLAITAGGFLLARLALGEIETPDQWLYPGTAVIVGIVVLLVARDRLVAPTLERRDGMLLLTCAALACFVPPALFSALHRVLLWGDQLHAHTLATIMVMISQLGAGMAIVGAWWIRRPR